VYNITVCILNKRRW